MTTIGVTLELPDPWAAELQEYRLGLGDASGQGIPAHITLLGPIDVDPDLMDDVLGHLRKVAESHPAFPIRLQGTDSFRPLSPTVFVHVEEGGQHCATLAEAVRTGPLGVDPEFPYHPHVTLAHAVDDHVLDRAHRDYAAFTCAFPADHIRVYHLPPGQDWTPLADLPLGDER